MPLESYQSSSVKIWLGRLDADDAEPHALDGDVAAHRIGAAEELGAERPADDGDGRAAALVVLGQAAAHARSVRFIQRP